jgi:hypothetical protein
MNEGHCVAQLRPEGKGTCYNATFESVDMGFLMLYRRNLSPVNGCGRDFIEYAFMDYDWRFVAKPCELKLEHEYYEDPRIIKCKDRWFVFFGGPYGDAKDWRSRRVYIAEIDVAPPRIELKHSPVCLVSPKSNVRCEKNWVPFVFEDELHIIYSITPHIVFRLGLDYYLEKRFESSECIMIPDQTISCGTPAKKIDTDHYLSFFHTVSFPYRHLAKSKCENNRRLSHTRDYQMGAYVFDSKPPFTLKYISRNPLFYNDMFSIPNERVTRNDSVVFPAGLIIEDDHKNVLVSLGENDSAIKVVRFEISEILALMVKPDIVNKYHSVHDRHVPCKIISNE